MRNTEKYVYVEVSLLKGSPLYQLLVADAEEGGLSLADVIKAHLVLFCKGARKNPPSDWNSPSAPAKGTEGEISQEKTRSSRRTSVAARKRAPSSNESLANEEKPLAGFDLSKAMASADLFDQLN